MIRLTNRFVAIGVCLIALIGVNSCSEEEPEIMVDPIEISSFSAIDIGNVVSSTDILVKFEFSEGVEAIKLFIVPSSSRSSLTQERLSGVSTGSFQEVEVISSTRKEYSFELPEMSDFQGNAITNDVAYSIVLLYEKEGVAFIGERSGSVTLTDDSPILGRYAGSWNDNLFSNIDISFWLNEQNGNRVTGSFYISSNFRPAWGGEENDGTVTFLLNEDGTNTFSFQYNQDLPDYMGGCPGLYTGDGEFSTLSVSISFIGDDCDGEHENGVIRVERSL